MREKDAVRVFREAVMIRAAGRCERCRAYVGEIMLDAHHLVPRSRGVGWSGLHELENGAALCAGGYGCHMRVHRHEVADWEKWIRRRP